MLRAPLAPPPLYRTWTGREPGGAVRMRAAELPGILALPIRDLTPWLPEPVWAPIPEWGPTDVREIRTRTRTRVEAMDWSMIAAGETVDVLANPHGFALCGEAYVAMLEEITAHVRDTTGATVRLRIAESMGHIENPDWISVYDLAARSTTCSSARRSTAAPRCRRASGVSGSTASCSRPTTSSTPT
jgi:hypothetical protein